MIANRLSARFLSMTLAAFVVTLLVAPQSDAQTAAALYTQHCAGCHGTSGKGDGPAGKYLKPAPADFAVSLKGKSDAWIAKSIKEGGKAVGESPVMPASPDLSDDQVKGLVDYVKHFGS